MSPRSSRLVTLLGGAAGAGLFIYAVERAGTAQIIEGIGRVGWGLAAILALAGLRFVVRAECWRLCVPPSARLTRLQAFAAFLAGDAVGNVTPLGLLASEPTKVLLTRHHLATRESVSSLALENLVYAASVVAMVVIGIVVLLGTVPMSRAWFWAGIGAIGVLGACSFAAARVLRGTWDEERGERPRWRQRLAGVRVEVVRASGESHALFWRVFALDLCFHALAVIETFITLRWLLADRVVTFPHAVVFEALNRVITVAFKFVPFRIGVDEAFSGGFAALLAIDPAAGVALAVVRKIRNLAWSAIGLAIVAAHPARTSSAVVASPGHGATGSRR